MRRWQRAQFDEVLGLDEAARGAECGDHHDLIAEPGIADPVQPGRIRERNDDASAAFGANGAGDRQGPARHRDGVADIDDPARPIGIEAGQQRTREADAHDTFAVETAHEFGAADQSGGVGRQRRYVDAGRTVEHHPQHIGAAEHGGRCRHRERQFDFEIVAAAVDDGDHRRIRIGRRPRRRGNRGRFDCGQDDGRCNFWRRGGRCGRGDRSSGDRLGFRRR